jgi:hypothetical protein
MPTPRRYANQAERQASYRQRLAAVREQELQVKGLPSLPTIPTIPGVRRWELLRRQAQGLLQTALEEMQSYQEQRSDAWRESERGERMAELIPALEDIVAALEELDPNAW